VIGAGVAGPATALFLKRVGISATVYEARPPGDGAGGGVVVAPNGMNVLAALGLARKVKDRGSIVVENRYFTESGRRLARYSNGGDRYGEPAVALLRGDLHRILIDELQSQGIEVRYRKRLVHVEPRETNKVVASFADGTTARGDLLMGADGVQSLTRAAVFPDAPAPKFAGLVGVGGLVPTAGLAKEDRNSVHFTFGARGYFGFCGARGGSVMWWSHVWRDKPLTQAELADRSLEGLQRELRDAYGAYHAPIGELIENTGAPLRLNVFDLPSLPTWHRARVVLVGDAAHAMTPTSGQAAALALEDAMDLARCLRDTGTDHARAFEIFQRGRRERVERIVAAGRRRDGERLAITPFQARVRDLGLWVGLNLFGERSQDWMYRYRVDWTSGGAPPGAG
jgi:2-polyprenyl-6-methoxyphenol hydroxylase-like FAD-dependent oxidoreductase